MSDKRHRLNEVKFEQNESHQEVVGASATHAAPYKTSSLRLRNSIGPENDSERREQEREGLLSTLLPCSSQSSSPLSSWLKVSYRSLVYQSLPSFAFHRAFVLLVRAAIVLRTDGEENFISFAADTGGGDAIITVSFHYLHSKGMTSGSTICAVRNTVCCGSK